MPRNHVWLQVASTHAHVQGAATAAARVTADVARTAANRATQGASRRGAAADGGAVFSHRLSTRGGRQDRGRHKRQCSKSNREYQGSSHFEHWLPSPCAGSIRRQMSSVSLAGSLEKYHVARRHATSSQVLTVILPLLWPRTSFHRDGALATERARGIDAPFGLRAQSRGAEQRDEWAPYWLSAFIHWISRAPKSASFLSPIPRMSRSASWVAGRMRASSRSVASCRTTNAATPRSTAISRRSVRSFSKRASSTSCHESCSILVLGDLGFFASSSRTGRLPRITSHDTAFSFSVGRSPAVRSSRPSSIS